MQTRLVAAASGALFALGLSLLALRPAVARPDAAASAPGLSAGEVLPTRAAALPPAAGPAIRPVSTLPPSPEIRAEVALTIGDREQRTAALAEALAAWAVSDAGDALVWLERHPAQDKALLTQAIGEGLATDPAGTTFALSYLSQDREFGGALAGALVRALAAHGNSPAAVRLANATPAGWAREWATVAFTNLAYEDAATALEALAAVGDPTLRRTAAAAIIAGWAERDPAECAAYCAILEPRS